MEFHVDCPICAEIRRIVNDRLFELRSKGPKPMTKERCILSHIQLIQHESEDGFRGYSCQDFELKTGTFANTHDIS